MTRLESIKSHVFNAPGWRADRRIVVFESDDWGSIRTPNSEAFQVLANSKTGVFVDRFDALDCLESADDFEKLAETLEAVRRAYGVTVPFTLNVVLQNPDFEAIRAENFGRYIPIGLSDSYLKYRGEDLCPIWNEMQGVGLVKPQFHAREHLNVRLWMRDLQLGLPAVREAFDLGLFGQMCTTSSPHQGHYLAAYHASDAADLQEKAEIVRHGLRIFYETFGFHSETIIPCNYIWPAGIENVLRNAGVRGMQGARIVKVPDIQAAGRCKTRRRFLKPGNSDELTQLVRNVTFEQYANAGRDCVPDAIRQVSTAFAWRKPAIISTHRINYVGSLDCRHRDRSLRQLFELISAIVARWADTEFMTSDQLVAVMRADS